jgi:hypothetical protein
MCCLGVFIYLYYFCIDKLTLLHPFFFLCRFQQDRVKRKQKIDRFALSLSMVRGCRRSRWGGGGGRRRRRWEEDEHRYRLNVNQRNSLPIRPRPRRSRRRSPPVGARASRSGPAASGAAATHWALGPESAGQSLEPAFLIRARVCPPRHVPDEP